MLLSCKIILTDSDNGILILTLNHIIIDGWSMELLLNQLITSFNNLKNSRSCIFPVKRWDSKEYSIWENSILNSAAGIEMKDYWLKMLGHPPLYLLRPLYRHSPNPALKSYKTQMSQELVSIQKKVPINTQTLHGASLRIKTYPSNSYTLKVDKRQFENLKRIAQEQKVSFFSLLITISIITLHRATFSNDIILGIVVATRDEGETKDILGWLSNTLFVRTRLDDYEGIDHLLQKVYRQLFTSLEYKLYPLGKLLYDLDVSLDAIGSLSLNYLNYSEPTETIPPNTNDIEATLTENSGFSHFDVDLVMREYVDGMEIKLSYKQEVFSPTKIVMLMQIFRSIVNCMCKRPLRELTVERLWHFRAES